MGPKQGGEQGGGATACPDPQQLQQLATLERGAVHGSLLELRWPVERCRDLLLFGCLDVDFYLNWKAACSSNPTGFIP